MAGNRDSFPLSMAVSKGQETILHRAQQLLKEALVWDNHACMPLRPRDESFLPQIERFRNGGADVVSLNLGCGPFPLEDHLRMVATFRKWFAAREDHYKLVNTVADIKRAKQDGKLAILFDVEGMAPLDGGDHGLIQLFYDLGVRWMLVAYNRNNAAGGGCLDNDGGLTDHGRGLLREMKRCGMVVCCSHTGHRTALDVIERAENPVIFSHSNPSALRAHPRNIPDDLITACAQSGGVVGVNGIGGFLGDNDNRPETMVRHIDYVVQLVGPDHVGISLDYVFDPNEDLGMSSETRRYFFHSDDNPPSTEPTKYVAPEAFSAVTKGLIDLGYADADIFKILGGNWCRVAEEVWR